MEKILVVSDAACINMNVVDFSCFIAKITHSALTGIFLENPGAEDVPVIKRVFGMPYVETILAGDLPGHDNRQKQCDGNIHSFIEACQNRGVICSAHRNKKEHMAGIIKESRFADVLIIDAEASIYEHDTGVPTRFAKEVFLKAECPVIIAPPEFNGIDEIVLAYDGSRSAVFAIRQFIYLFPVFSDKKITLLQVSEETDLSVIEKERITELLQPHFSAVQFHVLQGKTKDELFCYLLNRKDIFVVTGAFGRNAIAAFFRHSAAELLLKTVNLPVFMTHC